MNLSTQYRKKPKIANIIIPFNIQQRYKMFLNIQNYTKKIPKFLWGLGRNTYVCQSKDTLLGWVQLFFKSLYIINFFNNLFCNINTFIYAGFFGNVILFNICFLQHFYRFELCHDHIFQFIQCFDK